MSTVPPIRREILVDANPETAFEVFTARVGKWWPVEDKSVYGAGTTVAFEDGQIIERSAVGQVAASAAAWVSASRARRVSARVCSACSARTRNSRRVRAMVHSPTMAHE